MEQPLYTVPLAQSGGRWEGPTLLWNQAWLNGYSLIAQATQFIAEQLETGVRQEKENESNGNLSTHR